MRPPGTSRKGGGGSWGERLGQNEAKKLARIGSISEACRRTITAWNRRYGRCFFFFASSFFKPLFSFFTITAKVINSLWRVERFEQGEGGRTLGRAGLTREAI